MKYHTVHPARQLEYSAAIGRFFGQLPPTQFRQVLNLRNTITSLDGRQTGSWTDILTADDAQPWLRAHLWLLAGWQEGERETLEKHLYLGMFFTYLRYWLNEAVLAPDTVFHAGYHPLAISLENEANRHFQRLLPSTHPFWQDDKAIKETYRSAIVWQNARERGSSLYFDTADWQHYADRLAPIKTGVTAGVHLLDRREDLTAVWQMIDAANQAFRIQQEILALRRDLMRGQLSYPIMQIMILAGLTVKRPFNPEQIMGGALLTGSIKKVCADAANHLEKSRQLADELNISGWADYCVEGQKVIDSLQSLFSLKGGGNKSHQLTFQPYRDIVGQTIRMARGYLLAEATFQESVEINRGGLEGLEEAQGIIFPLSFITYLLLENGHDLAVQVEEIFEKMAQLGYRYYENMAVAPDADEVGILLRLFKYSQNQAAHGRQLERPLHWLADNVYPDGTIPAFWDKVDVSMLKRMVVWENYCLTAEINTLLGLIDYDWPRFQPLIEQSAVGVFGRYLSSDFGTVAYYDLRYTLWQTLALARQLESRTANDQLLKLLVEANESLDKRLTLEAEQGAKSAQQAAFLIMACLDGQREVVLDPAWITLLSKTQRYDGSWDNEPFFITCDRDGLPGNWYSSRTMTTAFCYHALNSYQNWQHLS